MDLLLAFFLLLISQVALGDIVVDDSGQPHATGYRPKLTDILYPKTYESLPALDFPVSFDSRAKGWISPIKDQSQCGSCWAHSIVENLEDQLLKSGKGLKELSVAQMVDCNSAAYGCSGGDMTDGNYLVSAGSTLASLYPYYGRQGWCKNPLPPVVAKPVSWKFVGSPGQAPTVEELKAAIMQHASLYVLVSAGGYNWGGHQPMTACGNTYDNHMVEIVGWTHDGMWIMRNSWGTGWGDKGFGYIPFGCDNIATGPDSAAFLEL